jgi:hypothetical protein
MEFIGLAIGFLTFGAFGIILGGIYRHFAKTAQICPQCGDHSSFIFCVSYLRRMVCP